MAQSIAVRAASGKDKVVVVCALERYPDSQPWRSDPPRASREPSRNVLPYSIATHPGSNSKSRLLHYGMIFDQCESQQQKLSGPRDPLQMTRAVKYGISLVAIALVAWAGWTAWDKTRTWFIAKDVPISLSKGSHYVTHPVTTNMAALYSIVIDADWDRGHGARDSEAATPDPAKTETRIVYLLS
jgi:hypothetical protein